MPLGKNEKLNATIDERTKYILKDYKYFTQNPDLMKKALEVLKRIIPKDDFINIEKSSFGSYVLHDELRKDILWIRYIPNGYCFRSGVNLSYLIVFY